MADDVNTKRCPKCGSHMALFFSEIPEPWDPDFWLCENPDCKYKENQ